MNFILYLVKNRTIRYHLLGWLTFIAYEIIFVILIGAADPKASILGGYIIPYLINISLFYFHAFVIVGDNVRRWRHPFILILFLTCIEMAVYLLLMVTNNWLFHGATPRYIQFVSEFPKTTYIKQAFRGIYFMLFSTSFWFVYNYFKNQKRLKEAETKALTEQKEKAMMEVELVSAQNAFLQSQINPHLLFNTLNFIHSEVQQASPTASEAIIILSDMMRYSLSETKGDGKVLLENEIEQIENLISINQFRFNNKLHLQVSVNGMITTDHRIIPLLLVPFVENLFKYAELLDENNPAQVTMNITPGQLNFETFNRKRKTVNFHSPGIGIDNVQKRLNAFYPGNFVLETRDEASTFLVRLSINL